MGVPGFFSWLLKLTKLTNNTKEQLTDVKLSSRPSRFYLDYNSMIHPSCQKTISELTHTISDNDLEILMIKRIIKDLDTIIELVNPQEYVYIAIDGVAPLAKINQQRTRRYKSVYETDIKNGIKTKYKKSIYTNWSSIAITPGTEFMNKLHAEILKYISKKKRKIIYSSYHEPGEGEHKILQDIKKNINNDNTYVIYGLDADLIFLSLASQKNNIYLMREESICFDDKLSINYIYVSINNTKIAINTQISSMVNSKYIKMNISNNNNNNPNFVNDFIFVCYFLGNDFLPHFPSIDIKTHGLEYLLDCYCDIYILSQTSLINNNFTINEAFLDMFLSRVSNNEIYYFREIFPKHLEYVSKRKCPENELYEKEIWNLENLKNLNIEDPIKLGYDTPILWKYRYYEYHFGIKKSQNDLINSLCYEYLNGLYWVTKYYFEECIDPSWQYPSIHAPFLSDLYIYHHNNKFVPKFNKTGFILPEVQLLLVIPPSKSYIVPEKYRSFMTSNNSPIIDLYPKIFELDLLYKDSYWKCNPILPLIDLNRVLNAIKNT